MAYLAPLLAEHEISPPWFGVAWGRFRRANAVPDGYPYRYGLRGHERIPQQLVGARDSEEILRFERMEDLVIYS